MFNLLLVEDDKILGKSLSIKLKIENYNVTWAQTLKEARDIKNDTTFNLIILDVNLPDGNGIEYCAEIRTKNKDLPIIILTAQIDETSVVKGLEAGANDYVRKPFSNVELMARIMSTLKLSNSAQDKIAYENLSIDLEKRKCLYSGKEIVISQKHLEILIYFIRNAEKVVTREKILDYLNSESDIFDRTIDAHISQIRKKLKNSGIADIAISSIYGAGYRLEIKK